MSRKYVAAVGLLAVLALVFGVLGTVAPPLAEEGSPVQPQEGSPSESVGHFQNPPSYDSGWVDIQDRKGQSFNITHNLNSTEIVVDITGKRTLAGGEHRRNFGLREVSVPLWSEAYGGTGQDSCYSIVQTRDGGYALAGYASSYGGAWLVKTNSVGTMQWSRAFGGSSVAISLVETGDGGYALAGYINSGASSYDFWLAKTDSAGNQLWNRTYGGTYPDYGRSLVQTDDGGYALTGYTKSYGVGAPSWENAYLVKTDSAGIMQWNQTYGGGMAEYCVSVVQTSDGGYALASSTNSYGAGSNDFWLVKTDSAGSALWNRTYGGVNSDQPCSLVQTGDGGYALAGQTSSYGAGSNDAWLVKTDSAGNIQWSRTYGGTSADTAYVVQTCEGGYILAGSTLSYGVGTPTYNNMYLFKTDSAGTMLWSKTYGGTSTDYCYSMVQTIEDGTYAGMYALAGETYSYGAGSCDFYFVRTEGVASGVVWIDTTRNSVLLHRGRTDPDWNYVRVRVWLIEEPSWIYGDINMDGVVDAKDLYIIGRNYGQTFSLLSFGGIVAIAGVRTVKKRKQTKQPR